MAQVKHSLKSDRTRQSADRSIIITFSNVLHVEFRTSKLPFNIGPIIDLIDRFFEHGNQRVDQNRDTDKGE